MTRAASASRILFFTKVKGRLSRSRPRIFATSSSESPSSFWSAMTLRRSSAAVSFSTGRMATEGEGRLLARISPLRSRMLPRRGSTLTTF